MRKFRHWIGEKGEKVLLIDADAQGNLAACLGIGEPDNLEVTLVNILAKVVKSEK